jgi:dTDP-4-dehydrorhamnose 3,5-epimerase
MVKFVLYDDRPESPTRGELMELFIGEKNPLLVKIPPMVLHGMKGIGTDTAYMLNCPTLPYDHDRPDELRRPPDDPSIPYNWHTKEG